jgi:hypothetical protein
MSAEEIIELYKDSDGYVLDINDLIRFLKEHTEIDSKERNIILARIISWNIEVEKKNRETLLDRKSTTRKEETASQETTKKEERKKEESSLIDVTSYINALKQCDDDDFLTELLPSIYDTNYESIIGSIVLYFYREISIANSMLQGETDIECIEYLKSLIERSKTIIRIIKEYTEEETIEDETVEEEQFNRLIFLRKPTNNSLFIDDDIDDISIEDDVLPILEDIIKGKNTREKRFHNENSLKGISAIRRRDSRIIFVRLENNVILILGILVKRFQNTQSYRDMLESRAKTFRAQKDELKENITNLDFIEEHDLIKDRIIATLKARKKN